MCKCAPLRLKHVLKLLWQRSIRVLDGAAQLGPMKGRFVRLLVACYWYSEMDASEIVGDVRLIGILSSGSFATAPPQHLQQVSDTFCQERLEAA